MFLHKNTNNLSPLRHCLGHHSPIRQPSILQTFPQKLPSHHRRWKRGVHQGGPGEHVLRNNSPVTTLHLANGDGTRLLWIRYVVDVPLRILRRKPLVFVETSYDVTCGH
ncbi:hypothetical protein Tco_0623804 [Tanacetum coccineum]|uniref:Uncharacterized protein n=1 Tax=Tanacetum coccineum TaxID=301880 RepID=A0ABQ4WC90_9ASTR